jgi:uncharacterized protein YcfL
MKRLSAALLLAIAGLAFVGCASKSVSEGVSVLEDYKGQSVYTQRNLWFQEGVHETTNYHVSTMVPVNSRVTITETTSELIVIKTSDGTDYTIVNIPEYTKEDIKAIYERYFGDTKVDLSRFSAQQRRAIEKGMIKEGMSKEALLVARGYPPAHKTPSLDRNQWRYWKSAHNSRVVFFDGDRVTRIKD